MEMVDVGGDRCFWPQQARGRRIKAAAVRGGFGDSKEAEV